MRAAAGTLLFAAVLTACTRTPAVEPPPPVPAFVVHHLDSTTTPSPLDEVTAGHVRAVFPQDWQVRPIASGAVPQEGFIASPRLDRFEKAAGVVQGIEAFWINVGDVGIPSNYYYLAAKNESLTSFGSTNRCQLGERQVLLDRPPDLSGAHFSPGDYVAKATGTCLLHGQPARWAYIVAAPGFGPVRQVGLPNSGLYVVLAVVSGPNADRLLSEMLQGARFGDTSIAKIVRVAAKVS